MTNFYGQNDNWKVPAEGTLAHFAMFCFLGHMTNEETLEEAIKAGFVNTTLKSIARRRSEVRAALKNSRYRPPTNSEAWGLSSFHIADHPHYRKLATRKAAA